LEQPPQKLGRLSKPPSVLHKQIALTALVKELAASLLDHPGTTPKHTGLIIELLNQVVHLSQEDMYDSQTEQAAPADPGVDKEDSGGH